MCSTVVKRKNEIFSRSAYVDVKFLKAAKFVTFDLLVLELMFLFFEHSKKQNSGIHFTNYGNLNKSSVSKQQHLC